jgi:IS30 family transposase
VDRKTAFSCTDRSGGIRPRQGQASRDKRLSLKDRCAIEAGLAVTETQNSIAGQIGFDKSTVSREFGRGWLASGRYSAKRD